MKGDSPRQGNRLSVNVVIVRILLGEPENEHLFVLMEIGNFAALMDYDII